MEGVSWLPYGSVRKASTWAMRDARDDKDVADLGSVGGHRALPLSQKQPRARTTCHHLSRTKRGGNFVTASAASPQLLYLVAVIADDCPADTTLQSIGKTLYSYVPNPYR
jgi:hypothetical protein